MKTLISICFLAVTLPLTMGTAFAQSAKADADQYQWSAELVAFDEPARIATVKVQFVGTEQPAAELTKFKAGDHIMLRWSGADRYASGIRSVAKYTPTRKSDDRFYMPAEFVSFDMNSKQITFKAHVPAEGVVKIKALKPGEWITATSLHGKATEAEPIVSIRPFVIQPNESSTSN